MAFGLKDFWHLGLGVRVLGGEHRAAVLVGQDGGLERVNVARDAHDFLLVHANAGAEYGQLAHRAGHRHGGHGLAGHLAERLARDERAAAVLDRDLFRNAHHKAAHDEGEQLFVALFADFLLDFGERHDHDAHAAAPHGQLAAELEHFFLGALRGVGIAEKVHAHKLQPALGHHPARNRAVDAAREQQRRAAVRADRHAARARLGAGVDKGVLFAHLNVHGQVGVVHIRAYIREQVGQLAADVLADLGRGHGELFVPALGFNLEGLCLRKARRKVGLRGCDHALERLFRADRRARDGCKAEHMACTVHHRVCVCLLGHFDIDNRLPHGDLAVRDVLHAPGQVFEQAVLKGFAVETLEHDLAALEQ